MWSAEKLLDFVEAGKAAIFNNMVWSGTSLTFDFRVPVRGLSALHVF